MPRLTTIGFPRMMKEQGERRVFLPDFIQYLTRLGADVAIEEGYGSRSGFDFDDYRQGSETVRRVTREQAFQQDIVLVLRSPRLEEFGLLRPGACLMSMLHFPTRPKRVEELRRLELKAISLDSISNDRSLRLVENMRAVAWNGLEASFAVLESRFPGLRRPDGQPMHVLILGSGMVGKHAVDAATKLGNVERNSQHMQDGGPGSIALTIGRNLSSNATLIERLFRNTDVLVDASQRRTSSVPIVPNAWLAWLPEHAVIADLAVDPYTLDIDPPVVRGVEGIPQGNLDQYVFHPADPEWDRSVPAGIPSRHRRTVVSCYSWPGIHPEACMTHYALQLEPLMETLLRRGYDNLTMGGDYFERALYRGTLAEWMRAGHYESRPR